METPKSKLNKVTETKRELEVEVSPEEVAKEFDVALVEYASRAKLKGFRQGKAPLDLVKSTYYADIKEALISSLAPKAINQELKALKLIPVDSPVLTDIKFEEGQPLKLKAEFEVWPEFSLPEYKKLKIKKVTENVTAKDVNKSLEDLQEKSAQYIPVEGRGVVDNDYVVAQIQGKDMATKRLLPSEKIFVLAGHPDNEKTLNESLIGMKVDEEKNFTVIYADDYQKKKLAGKKIDYHLKVVSIKEKSLPALDDSFAKDLGKFESLKDLKAEIRKQLKEAREKKQQRDVTEEVMKQIADKVKIELPESIVQRETLGNLQQILQSHPHQATKKEDMESIQEEAKLRAESTIKNHLILTKIAEQEKLEVTEEDITEEYKVLAEANNIPLARVVEIMNKEGKKEEVRQNLLLKKTIDFLVENAIIE